MYMKRYTISALILIALVGWYVYAFITHESMSINVFGIDLPSLSIAVWIIIPLVVLYFASIAHMTLYSILGGFKLRKYEKDYDKIIDSIVDAYLSKKERNHAFKTERYQLLGTLIDSATLFPNSEPVTTNVKVSAVLTVIQSIKQGEVVDLKPYNLKFNNELVIQNSRNRYKSGDLNAEEILSHSSEYTKELCQEIYADFVTTSPLYAIEQYKEFLTKESLYKVLERINAPENTLEISNETISKLLGTLEIDTQEYIKISLALSHGMIPEQRIKLFEMLSTENDDATEAYLFTLFDLEMVSVANELLAISQDDEYLKFKAYSALRESNKNFSINLFV